MLGAAGCGQHSRSPHTCQPACGSNKSPGTARCQRLWPIEARMIAYISVCQLQPWLRVNVLVMTNGWRTALAHRLCTQPAICHAPENTMSGKMIMGSRLTATVTSSTRQPMRMPSDEPPASSKMNVTRKLHVHLGQVWQRQTSGQLTSYLSQHIATSQQL